MLCLEQGIHKLGLLLLLLLLVFTTIFMAIAGIVDVVGGRRRRGEQGAAGHLQELDFSFLGMLFVTFAHKKIVLWLSCWNSVCVLLDFCF